MKETNAKGGGIMEIKEGKMENKVVYVVIIESYLEVHEIDTEVFATYEDAKKFYDEKVEWFKDDIKNIIDEDEYVLSDSGDSFEGYRDGDYPNDHQTITLLTRVIL